MKHDNIYNTFFKKILCFYVPGCYKYYVCCSSLCRNALALLYMCIVFQIKLVEMNYMLMYNIYAHSSILTLLLS